MDVGEVGCNLLFAVPVRNILEAVANGLCVLITVSSMEEILPFFLAGAALRTRGP